MTRDGQCYELAVSEPATIAKDGSALPHLPSPLASDAGRGPDSKQRDRSDYGGINLTTAIAWLFPKERAERYFKTPTAQLGVNGAPQHPDKRKAGGHGPTLEDEVAFLLNVEADAELPPGPHSPPEWWNEFWPVVYRWEQITQTAAPVPVEFGPRGGRKLSPKFAEWMMGIPAGHVTDVQGLDRKEQLIRIGNGAMSLQAYFAYLLLLDGMEMGA
jgi:hypothetical protein